MVAKLVFTGFVLDKTSSYLPYNLFSFFVRSFALDIPYTKHQDYLEEAILCVQAQACVPFHHATPQKIFSNIDSLFNDFLFKNHAGKQAHLYALKCY